MDQQVSRRKFLQDAALLSLVSSLSLTMGELVSAEAAAPTSLLKRSNALSKDGKAMLKVYAEGVAKMRALPAYDPRSWIFQANIHDCPAGAATTSIFDPKPSSTKAQKAAMAKGKILALGSGATPGVFKTCSHFGYPEHFLTWHRIYLYWFEKIIASLTGKPFALPYWAYEKNSAGFRSLPPEFLSPANKNNPLWFSPRRITKPTQGIETDGEASHDEAFSEVGLLMSADGSGFSSMLEGTPHGAIHVAVGPPGGMGSTVYAARDPIFWLHHANIDRLWESWRRASPQRPEEGTYQRDPITDASWKTHAKFPFATQASLRDETLVLDALNAVKKFKLDYDRYEPAPSSDVVMGVAGEERTTQVAATTLSNAQATPSAQIRKKGEPVVVKLKPAATPEVAFGFGEKPETRYKLIVDVETSGPTSAAHAAYLDVLEASGSTKKVKRLIKVFNLFGAGHDAAGAHHAGPVQATWTADVTDLVKAKVLDPLNPGDLTFIAKYGDPETPIVLKGYRIDAE